MNVEQFFTSPDLVKARLNLAMMVAFPAELLGRQIGESQSRARRRQIAASKAIRHELECLAEELLNAEDDPTDQPGSDPDKLDADFDTPEPARPDPFEGQHADHLRCFYCGERHG